MRILAATLVAALLLVSTVGRAERPTRAGADAMQLAALRRALRPVPGRVDRRALELASLGSGSRLLAAPVLGYVGAYGGGGGGPVASSDMPDPFAPSGSEWEITAPATLFFNGGLATIKFSAAFGFAVDDGAGNRMITVADGGSVGNLSVTGAVTVGSGTAVAKVQKTATASTDLGGATTVTCTAETNFAITGVAVGDACVVQTPAALAATDWIECRTLVDNVALKYCTFGTAVDPAAMVFHITTIEY